MPIRVKKLASNINFLNMRALYRGLSQSEENKCLLGILFGAGRSRRYVPTVMVPVVIFGGKNKCDQPTKLSLALDGVLYLRSSNSRLHYATHRYEYITSIAITRKLISPGINIEIKAGRKNTRDVVA